VATVEVTPATRTLTIGETVQLTATARDAGGNVLSGRAVSWSSEPASVASVSNAGLATAVAIGSATITATAEGRSGSAVITVAPPLPAPSCTDCLEVVPGSLLLTTIGAQLQLAAYLVSAGGVRTPVAATYVSARPGTASVTPAGLVTAVAVGSAQITAQGGGKTSAPVVALVATPVAGAMVIGDDQVDGTPQPIDPDAEIGIGYRYTIRLRGAPPAIGQMIVGAGSTPLLGRVERVTPVAGGMSEVEVQVRPVAEILPNFSLDETWQLDPPPDVGGGGTGPDGAAPMATVQRPLNEGEFPVGPMTCKADAEAGFTIPLALQVEAMELSPALSATLVYSNGDLRGMALFGELRPRLILTPRVQAALEASLTCKVILYELPIRVRGPLALVIAPKVPVGLGFKFGGKVPAQAGARIGVEGVFRLGVAWACANGQCAQAVNPDATVDGIFEPLLGGPVTGQVDLSASVFAFAEVEVEAPAAAALGKHVEVKILEVIGGLRQTITVAPPAIQANSPTYAASAALELFSEAKSELKVALGSLWSLEAWEASFEAAQPLARTPQGLLQAIPTSVAAGNQGGPGEPVLLRVSLNSTTWLTLDAVEGVEIFWSTPTGLVSVCGFMEPDHPGQSDFECELAFLEEHVGSQTFYAFVTARIYGAAFATPFEVAPDSKITVQVGAPLSGAKVYFWARAGTLSPGACQDLKIQETGTSASLSAQMACSTGGGNFTTNVDNTTSLLAGRISGTVTRGASTGGTNVGATGWNQVEDVIVINAPGLAGSQGSFSVAIGLAGTMSVTGPCSFSVSASAGWELRGFVRQTGASPEMLLPGGDVYNSIHDCQPVGPGPLLPTTVLGTPITFTYGVPFQLMYSRLAYAAVSVTTSGPVSAYTASIDVTFTWLGMTGLPANAILTSATGVDWSKPAPP